MKASFFFIIAAVVVAAVLIAGCKPHDLLAKGQSENVTECAADADCGVGGCSGQVCTAASEAAGVITTCEYLEEYGCLKLTSCGCVNWKCAWRQNAEYANCLEKAKLPKPQ